MTSDECPKCGGDGIRPTTNGWKCPWCGHAWRRGGSAARGFGNEQVVWVTF
jgi:transposase